MSNITLIKNLSDDDFLHYARFFVRDQTPLKEYIELRDMIKQRLNNMGYSFEQGCCGTNNIRRIK